MLKQPDGILRGKAIIAYYSPSYRSGGLRRKCCAKRPLRRGATSLKPFSKVEATASAPVLSHILLSFVAKKSGVPLGYAEAQLSLLSHASKTESSSKSLVAHHRCSYLLEQEYLLLSYRHHAPAREFLPLTMNSRLT